MSMGEETMGVRMLILRVSLVVRFTCAFSGRFVVRHGAQGKVGASDSKRCGGARRGGGEEGALFRHSRRSRGSRCDRGGR